MNYEYQYPEPEPYFLDNHDPGSTCNMITIEPFNYLVMCFGAGIGYFILGGSISIFFCKKLAANEDVILANPI
jgi:hypothetical protein